MEEELISVIVPINNVEPYLGRCLQSIWDQTYKNLEIILVDDGSTDRSGQMCDEYAQKDPRARVIHQPNMGPGEARNSGLDAASGKYLFFSDADDYFQPDMIRLLHEAINWGGHPYPLSVCNARKAAPDDPMGGLCEKPRFTYLSQEDLLHALFNARHNTFYAVNQWNKLYRVAALQGLRFRNYSRAQDLDFQMRLFLRIDGAMLVEEKLYYWVQRPSSISNTPDAAFLRHACVTEQTSRNYCDLTQEPYPFRHYLLHFMYKRMVFYKNIVWKTDKQREVFSQCKEYERRTRKEYLTCGHESLSCKLFVLFLLHCPPLTRLLMILSRNR